jgi:hypothetical protein
MRGRSLTSDTHDPFGWLKTSGLVAIVFAAMLTSAIGLAQANQCAASCRSQHNACRVSTKGAPSCDAALQSCVARCMSAAGKK